MSSFLKLASPEVVLTAFRLMELAINNRDFRQEAFSQELELLFQRAPENRAHEFIQSITLTCLAQQEGRPSEFEQHLRRSFRILYDSGFDENEIGLLTLVLALWRRDAAENGHVIKFNKPYQIKFSPGKISRELAEVLLTIEPRIADHIDVGDLIGKSFLTD